MLKYFIFLVLLLPFSLSAQVEICDNGIDDDGDGLVDLNDEDCVCATLAPTSLIPNPSFEEMNCCPANRSELDCADNWVQASEPTTDFIHYCGWFGWEQFPPPEPFPDGEGIMGFRDGRVRGNDNAEANWKEYAGACLTNPLLAGITYRFQFDVGFVNQQVSPPITVTFFGSRDCDNLPFGRGDDAFGCPTNGPDWIELGDVNVFGGSGNRWEEAFIEVTPIVDIYTIAIGPPCKFTTANESTYYFFDNLILDNLQAFNFQISEIEHPCNPEFTLSVNSDPDLEYQWYLDGVALDDEVETMLSQNYGPGEYQIRILDDTGCRISEPYRYTIPNFIDFDEVTICEGETYSINGRPLESPGVYSDTLISQNGCDSIVIVDFDIVGLEFDTVEVALFAGDKFEVNNQTLSRPGDYPLTLTSSLGCDSLVLFQLTNFEVFVPNAFTPNDDGINDVFHPFLPRGQNISYDMQIFDRWGNLVFEGQEWDGDEFQNGVFVYVIRLDLEFSEPKILSGSISFLR